MHKINRLRIGGIGLILAVLLIGPFYQGLFFPVPMLTAISAITIGFGLWLYGRRQDRLALGLPGGWAGGFLLALTLIYVMQFGWAAYARGNLDWVLRVVAAWMAFVTISQENSPQVRRWLSWTLIASAVAVSFLGVLEFGGFFGEYPVLKELFNIKIFKGRLYSVFQYPNAAGAFFLAAWMVGQGLMLEEKSLRRRLTLGALTSLLGVAIFLTLSRGIVVVLPFALLLLVGGLARRQWLTASLYAIATLGVPIAVAFMPLSEASGANWSMALLWAAVATAAGTVATLGAERITALAERLSARTVRFGLIALVTVAVAAGGIWFSSRPAAQAGAADLARLLDISLETQNVQTRMAFTRTAFQIFKDHPLGTGGFGWDRSYRRYQDASYITRETHNHYVQVLVEAGALGVLALAGGLGLALWAGFRNRQGDSIRWAMVAAGGMFAAHALVDFDLSYPILWILMWMLLAAGQTPSTAPAKGERSYVWPVAISAAALLAILSIDLTVAAQSFRSAEYAVLRKEYDLAMKLSERSVQLDPINSQHLKLVTVEKNLKRATQVDPHNATVWEALATRLEKESRLPEATAAARKALENQPMLIDRYVALARLSGLTLDQALLGGAREQALASARDLVTLGAQLDERITIATPNQHLYPGYPKLEWSPALHLAVGKGLMLTGDLKGAEQHLKAASADQSTTPVAALWLHALYTRKGDKAAVGAMSVKPEPAELLSPTYLALMKWQ